MKTYKLLDVVALNHDLPDHDLRTGDLGTIVEVYDRSNFEIEFVEASGHTRALLTLSSGDIRPVTSRDMLAVRTSAA
ncbi:MAG: DUF4926 domain-containing protein [Dehalococcoidia bacterium]